MDNSVGTFLPADPFTFSLSDRAYDLRHTIFGFPEEFPKSSGRPHNQASRSFTNSRQLENSAIANSGRRFEAVASFRLIWWNRGSSTRKKLSIWRPVVSGNMVYFGDIAVKG